MRIISGKLGGRIFSSPNGNRTHPMSEKARGGIFGALGDVSGLTVLDCYSGSGALGIEAVSRGAEFVICVDNDINAVNAIKQNISDLDISSRAKCVHSNVSSWSKNHTDTFDLVFADPPYDKLPAARISDLVKHINLGGILVLSWPKSVEIPNLDDAEIIHNKNYGDAQIVFYRRG